MALVSSDPHTADGDQRLDAGHHMACMLHAFVEVLHLAPLLVEFLEVPLEMFEVAEDFNLKSVVDLGGEQSGSEFG